MKLQFFQRTAADRAIIIQETAAQRGVLPVMVEFCTKSVPVKCVTVMAPPLRAELLAKVLLRMTAVAAEP